MKKLLQSILKSIANFLKKIEKAQMEQPVCRG